MLYIINTLYSFHLFNLFSDVFKLAPSESFLGFIVLNPNSIDLFNEGDFSFNVFLRRVLSKLFLSFRLLFLTDNLSNAETPLNVLFLTLSISNFGISISSFYYTYWILMKKLFSFFTRWSSFQTTRGIIKRFYRCRVYYHEFFIISNFIQLLRVLIPFFK